MLTFIVFVFTFALVVLARIDEPVPALSGYLAAYGTVAALGAFPDAEDRSRAARADSLGVGGAS
jgi:hypothetical protein